MENPRTESARAHDDSDLIEGMEDAPSFSTSSGGTLQRDVATQAELDAIGDPDGHHRVTKDNAVNNAEARPRTRAPDA